MTLKSDKYCTCGQSTKILGLEEYQNCLSAEGRIVFAQRRKIEADFDFIKDRMLVAKEQDARGLVAVHFPISSSSSQPPR